MLLNLVDEFHAITVNRNGLTGKKMGIKARHEGEEPFERSVRSENARPGLELLQWTGLMMMSCGRSHLGSLPAGSRE